MKWVVVGGCFRRSAILGLIRISMLLESCCLSMFKVFRISLNEYCCLVLNKSRIIAINYGTFKFAV